MQLCVEPRGESGPSGRRINSFELSERGRHTIAAMVGLLVSGLHVAQGTIHHEVLWKRVEAEVRGEGGRGEGENIHCTGSHYRTDWSRAPPHG